MQKVKLEVQRVCQNCSKIFFTKDEDAILCNNCLNYYLSLTDFNKQMEFILRK